MLFRSAMKELFLRETPIHNKFIERIEDYRNYDDPTKTEKIDITKFVSLGGDIENLKPLNRSNINYITRYNVCNTLASILGKEGVSIAHTILDSRGCDNVNEINSFYSCALSNRKEPSKLGLDILKKHGVIKSIDPEIKKTSDNIYKEHIKNLIEKSTENPFKQKKIMLSKNEYLSDKQDILLDPTKGGIIHDKINIILSPPGSGKCLGKNTPVLMFDGSIKKVQDIIVGDLLMGWDSKPRKVLSTTQGREEMFQIKPNFGEPWECNKSHILTLIESGVWQNHKNGNIDRKSVV